MSKTLEDVRDSFKNSGHQRKGQTKVTTITVSCGCGRFTSNDPNSWVAHKKAVHRKKRGKHKERKSDKRVRRRERARRKKQNKMT